MLTPFLLFGALAPSSVELLQCLHLFQVKGLSVCRWTRTRGFHPGSVGAPLCRKRIRTHRSAGGVWGGLRVEGGASPAFTANALRVLHQPGQQVRTVCAWAFVFAKFFFFLLFIKTFLHITVLQRQWWRDRLNPSFTFTSKAPHTLSWSRSDV